MTPATDEMALIRKQARDWIVRLADEPSLDDRAAFTRWVIADLRHQAAYDQARELWQDVAELKDMDPLREEVEAKADGRVVAFQRIESATTGAKPNRSPWGWVAGGAASAVAAGVAVAIALPLLLQPVHTTPEPEFVQTASTAIAEVREIDLPDGSSVILGARSQIDVSFYADERRVVLVDGDAFFDVQSDLDRPFIVDAGGSEVRVLGTEFDVRRSDDMVRVAVVEGLVEVSHGLAHSEGAADAPSDFSTVSTRRLEAGEAIDAVEGAALSDPHRAMAPGAWREGRLFYLDTPLAEVVADADRYTEQVLVIEDASINALSVSASFRTDAIDDLIDGLSASLPIEVERESNGRVVFRAGE